MSSESDKQTTDSSSPANVLTRIDEAVCAFDNEWRFTFVNDGAEAVLERTAQELLGETLWEAVPDIENTTFGRKLREVADTQQTVRFDNYSEATDSWFNVRLYPSDDGITACLYDITEEHGERFDLQRKRRLFEAVFEETEDALIVADADRRITDFNPAAEQLFGYNARDIIGNKSEPLYANTEDYERKGNQRFNEDAPERGETYVVEYERADGTTFDGETMGTPLKGPDGETLAFVASVRDVTARVTYEQQIESDNDVLRTFHTIATDEEREFDEQIESLLELGREHLGLDTGILSIVDGETYTVEYAVGPDGTVEKGAQYDLGETVCDSVVDAEELIAIPEAGAGEHATHPAYPEQTLEAYIGIPLVVNGEQYGTLNFSAEMPRNQSFTDGERTFVRLLAQWVGKELSRQQSRARARAHRTRLRKIIDMLPQLVFAKDRDGEFLLANEAVADAYGTTVEQLEGATDADFASSPEEARQFREDDRAVIESGERKVIPEEPLTTADGETRVMQTMKIPYDPVDHETEAILGVATDITELKERDAEIELQSEAMEVAMDGIAILDGDEYIYMNETHADIFGYEPEDLLGSEWRGLYDDEEIERFESEVFPSLADDREWRGEAVGRKADGTPVYQDLGLSLLDSGELICTNQDITERKEREQELERQRTRVRALFDESPDGIIVHDDTGEIIDANDTQLETLGFDRETFLSMNVVEFEVGVSHPELQELWAEMSVGDMLKIEGEHERQNGTTLPVEVWVNKAEMDGDKRYVAVSRDITERKAREQELREVKERLDLAVEGADVGIWDWDMETDAVTFNEQWAAMLDYSLEELEPTLETWENRVHPADMPHVEAQLEAHIAGETDLYDCEHRMQSKGGEWRWVRDVGKVVERETGEPTRAVGIHLDITEQKESELQLEEERDMFAQGPAVVFKWQNEEGWPVEYVSENVSETFGYTPAQLTSGEVPYAELIHDDDLDRVENVVETNSDETTERFSHDPYRIVTSSGEVRWVTDNTKIVRSNGEITHYLGYLSDITEQKRLEQSLRESERSLRELTSIAASTEQSFEEKLSALLELGRERLDIPYGFLNRLDDETQHVVRAVGDHPVLETGSKTPRSETYCRKTVQQDGVFDVQDAVAEGWENDLAYEKLDWGCYIGGTVFVDGNRYGALCFADDTSRDHEFDDTDRAFVKLLVQWVSYELAGNKLETRLQQMNETAQRLMGAPSRDEIATIAIESTERILDMPINGIWWHDDANERLVPAGMTEKATELLSEQPTLEPGGSLAYDVFDDGQARSYDDLTEAEELYNEETALNSEAVIPLGEHGVLSVGSTEPRAFSETGQNLLEVLSSTVEAALNRAQREKTLRETRQKLEQSNEELEQFAYAASHDLQEPLRTVSSYLTLLERRYANELDGDAIEFIEFAVDGADRMREMIQALLAYSRVDTRGQEFEPVSVGTLFERIEQDLTATIEERDATVSIPSTDLTVTGDNNQLSQLFQNLLENALKYNEGQPRVEISATRNGEMVRFEVSDNGIGMDPDQTDDIFEVFQRLHTNEEFDGTGIGLSICRKIVDRHDGGIDIESEPGEGSTFIVTLPQGGHNHD